MDHQELKIDSQRVLLSLCLEHIKVRTTIANSQEIEKKLLELIQKIGKKEINEEEEVVFSILVHISELEKITTLLKEENLNFKSSKISFLIVSFPDIFFEKFKKEAGEKFKAKIHKRFCVEYANESYFHISVFLEIASDFAKFFEDFKRENF